jgi:Uma2 family endonuclease
MDGLCLERRVYHAVDELAHAGCLAVRSARFPEGKIPVKADFAPDVAFEILSPSDSASQIQRKRLDYQQSSVVQVWFDLEKRLVELIYPDRPLQYFHEHQALTIDAVPGFSLDLKDLFSI